MLDTSKIRVIPDFPKKGIQFLDITTIMNNADYFQEVFNMLLDMAKEVKPDVIVGLEARGYFFAPALALALHVPFVPIRKAGKLPYTTYKATYQLEYGEASIEVHTDAMKENQRVLIFDDILATGGTAAAAIELVRKFNPTFIATHFLMEIQALKGRDKIAADDIRSLHLV
ncbi:MAG: adenine phosphoribosyltransferase [Bacteroidales bacterium]|nr:adenine phosphoribosyltransferase [Bacteroidales bacterium]